MDSEGSLNSIGTPVSELDIDTTAVEQRMQRLEQKTTPITPAIKYFWDQALNAPIDVEPTLHGDLHSRNVVVEKGGITGIIDWEDLTAGDRATDLAAIWMLFSNPKAFELTYSTVSTS